jgi:glycosyltransferase involved in cell wall biosynthesis
MLYYVSGADIPGRMAHTIQQMRMCAAFADRCDSVRFLHPGHSGTTRWTDVADYYGLEAAFEIEAIPTLEGTLDGLPYAGLLSTSASFTGTLTWRVLTGEIGPSDIVYSRDYYGVFLLNELLQLLPARKRPVLAYEHHDIISAHMKRRFFSSIDAVVTITHALRDYDIETYGVDPENCLVAPDGVDTQPYESTTKAGARSELDLPADEPLVVYTGHLHKGKGVEVLVDAAADISAPVYVVGGYEDDIERIRSERRVPENVVFTGFVQPSEIPSYQLAADVLVAPYTTASREFISPLKLFEYMAAGRPIVATGRPVLREVLTDGENALLARPDDPADLATQINALLADETLRATLSKQARGDVEAYTWTARADSILRFLRAKADACRY